MMDILNTLDTQAVTNLFILRSTVITRMMFTITETGAVWMIFTLTTILALAFYIHRYPHVANGLIVSVCTSGLITAILKTTVARPRPPIEFQAYYEPWFSFPSGHTALTTALVCFLAYIIWHSKKAHLERMMYATLLLCLAYVVGFSRVYLGVHYPSDVLGGFLVGVLSCWIGIRSMRYFTHDTPRRDTTRHR